MDDDLYKCVHCGFCLSSCPTYIETGLESESPRGRIALMKAVREERIPMTDKVISHWDSCLQCRACEIACPSGVEFGKLMSGIKSEIVELKIRNKRSKFFRRVALNPLFSNLILLKATSVLILIYNILQVKKLVSFLSNLGIVPKSIATLNSSVPTPQGSPFSAKTEFSTTSKIKVGLLKGCVMPLTEGDAMRSVVSLLKKNNLQVFIPELQGCCGALNHHAGEHQTAKMLAEKNIEAFLADDLDYIVIASAGCSAATKEYPSLFKKDSDMYSKALEIADKTRDIQELLIEIGLVKPSGVIDKKVVLQEPCHLINAQKISEEPLKILKMIPGLEVSTLENPNLCCGSAGIYSIINPEMSKKITERKMNQILLENPDIIATCNPGCSMQMKNYLRETKSTIEVKYVSEILDESYKKGED